jgi:membrane-associated phospholipid phosphatase
MHKRIGKRIPNAASPLLLLALVAMLGAAVTFSATVVQLDAALGRLARAAAGEFSWEGGFAVSALGGTDLVLPLTAAAVLALLALRHWRGAFTLACAVIATQGIVQLIKVVVERPRPAANDTLASASGFSFPSAHSATSMALYATLALVAARRCGPMPRAALIASAAALVAAIGGSRLVLGAHYPIDVLAGWLTGAALVAGSWLLARALLGPLERRGALPRRALA